jgi:hypothetical protein
MKKSTFILILSVVAFAFPSAGRPQSMNGTVSGTVTDQTGAVIPNAPVVLTSVGTGAQAKFTTNRDGIYSFPNVLPGIYDIAVSALGFREYVQRGISVRIGDAVRVDVKLELGASLQTIQVSANASPLNYGSPVLKEEITPDTILELPLIVAGGPRAVGAYITLIPGVTSASGETEALHMNGGMEYEGETIEDGVGIVFNSGGNGMFNLISDFPQSPDMIGEVQVLTSNYEPQYGNSASGAVILATKSGTDAFHGALYEYNRNTALNARMFDSVNRSPDIENEFGGSIGGPVKIPGLRSGRSKPFFFFDYERYRAAGAAVASTLSIPSEKERIGDFSDWTDSSGNLIPVYDPATLTVNANYNPSLPTGVGNLPYLRQQFMGCDGKTPNVICPTDPRLANSLATQWLKYLPTPTNSAPINNYLSPRPPASFYSERNMWDLRIDEYVGDKDHVGFSNYYLIYVPIPSELLPEPLGAGVNVDHASYNWMTRLFEDHTFSPTVLNHFAMGYTQPGNNYEGYTDVPYVNELPHIKGLAPYGSPTGIDFSDGFYSFDGHSIGRNWSISTTFNDLLTWVHGTHTLKFGGEYRRNSVNECGAGDPEGTVSFARGETGLLGINSGNPVASFLLGQVDSGALTAYGFGGCYYPRQKVYIAHAGDTWKVTPKMSVTYGLRYEVHTPADEKYNRQSFFDPLMPNPGAGDRLGALAFAGNKWGSASFGNGYPESLYYGDIGPRLGIAYALSSKTVVRTGYGLFYSDAKYPGWGMGLATDGFDANPAFSSTLGGMQPAFLLSQGYPGYAKPPFIDQSYDNGLSGPSYREFGGNRVPYTSQWDLAIEHQFTSNFYVSTAYVGNKGSHLYSLTAAPNALNPSLLSMGSQLYDQFGPTSTAVDGVPAPYSGWASQMVDCSANVAQALVPYPQYCGPLTAINENAGNSTYHSFQLKAEKRASHGIYLLASYTISKLISDVDSTQTSQDIGVTSQVMSPFERKRAKSISGMDIPQTAVISFVYGLPFGSGKHWLANSHGLLGRVVGGWEGTGVFHVNSGTPFIFRSSACTVPSQFVADCIPAILPGANPWAQQKGNFNPNKPLLNSAAFESPSEFNFYLGQGPRVSNLRGFGYRNQDFALIKNSRITEHVNFQIRAEFFNLWNWHIFDQQGNEFTTNPSAFTTDVASPSFGTWNGSVTSPRTIQVAGRLTF